MTEFAQQIAQGVLKVHFIGIGGAGSAPLAVILREWNCPVSGSDSADSAKLEKLRALGVKTFVGHKAEHLDRSTDLVVYSSAVPQSNAEREQAVLWGIPELRRGEFLALLSTTYQHLAAVSGSHGKSSVSAMLSFILRETGCKPGYMIGAEVDFPSSGRGDGNWFVTEVDESDGTHTFFQPTLGILTNIDDDHDWSVGGAEALQKNYRHFADSSTILIDVENAFPDHPNRLIPDQKRFAALLPDWFGFALKNAAAALCAAEYIGVPAEKAAEALKRFPGVKRRMTCHFANEEIVLIEDYAHHPAELNCSLEFLRHYYPDHAMTVIFQPHRYARLKKYIDRFVALLRPVECVWIPPVFAAWSEKSPVDHNTLAEQVGDHACTVTGNWQEAAQIIAQQLDRRKKNLIAVIGAGDVNQIIKPLLCALQKK